jgi:peptide deformylase
MNLRIAQLGQPVLRQRAVEVSDEEIRSPEFQRLIDDMLEALREAKGAGLAGPQVFAGKRLFLALVKPGQEGEERQPEVFINPRITGASREQEAAWEGCLSFVELLVLVTRPLAVRVEYLDRHGQPQTLELHHFPARVVLHEFDHLEGILTIDRAASSLDIVKASEIDTVREARGETKPSRESAP